MFSSLTKQRSGWRKFVSESVIAAGLAALLTACGGGGNSGNGPAAQSGTVQIGITDADGDFLRYAVDVVSLDLTKADGTVVHTLPTRRGWISRSMRISPSFSAVQQYPPGTTPRPPSP